MDGEGLKHHGLGVPSNHDRKGHCSAVEQ